MRLLSKPLEEMTLNELDELRSIVMGNKYQQCKNAKWAEHSAELAKKHEKNRENRLSTEERFEKLILPYILLYAKKYIKEGDIVKYEGASRGGIRKVISVSDYGTIGHVIGSWHKGVPYIESYTSENPFSKLMGVYRENLNGSKEPGGLKCWFDRKDIVQFIKSKQS